MQLYKEDEKTDVPKLPPHLKYFVDDLKRKITEIKVGSFIRIIKELLHRVENWNYLDSNKGCDYIKILKAQNKNTQCYSCYIILFFLTFLPSKMTSCFGLIRILN